MNVNSNKPTKYLLFVIKYLRKLMFNSHALLFGWNEVFDISSWIYIRRYKHCKALNNDENDKQRFIHSVLWILIYAGG